MPTRPEFPREAPPGRVRRRGRLDRAEAELRSSPGEWIVVGRYTSHEACSRARSRLNRNGFKATARRQPDGGVKLYACMPAKGCRCA